MCDISWTVRNLCATDGTTRHAILRGIAGAKFLPVWGLLYSRKRLFQRNYRCYAQHSVGHIKLVNYALPRNRQATLSDGCNVSGKTKVGGWTVTKRAFSEEEVKQRNVSKTGSNDGNCPRRQQRTSEDRWTVYRRLSCVRVVRAQTCAPLFIPTSSL